MNILGIDIGATHFKACLVDDNLLPVKGTEMTVDTVKPTTYANVLEQIISIAQKLNHTGPVAVGFAGAVEKGVIMNPAYKEPCWVNLPLQEKLKADLGVDACVVNDADAVLFAEIAHSPNTHKQKIFCFTCGTNGGGAIAFHDTVVENLEIGDNRTSAIRKKNELLTWQEWAKDANAFLWEIEATYWPDMFLMGGGFSEIHEEVLPHLKTATPIHVARFKNLSGCVGAAVCLTKQFEEKS